MLSTCCHRVSQFYHSLTWRDGATKVFLVLTILLYPFNLFPHGPFLKLTLYPLLFLFLLNVDRLLKLTWTHRYFRYLAIVATLWFLWMFISLCFAVGFSAIEGKHLANILNDIKRFVPWYTFAGCCFLLPRDEIKRLLYWSFVGLFSYCACYSILEFLHFLEVAWATDVLKVAIKGFMSTELGAWTNGNFWPPILWDSVRYRSVFEEPAYFAILLGFCILLFTYAAWMAKKESGFWGNLCLSLLALVLLCQTRGAAGAISLTVASVVWIGLALCRISKMSRILRWRFPLLAIFLLVGSYFALTTQRHSAESITGASSRGKTTRAIHLTAELNCVAASPIYGCGVGEYGEVMREALRTQQDQTHEVEVWIGRDNEPPKLNFFTGIMVTTGIVGGLLFMAWFAFPAVVLWLKKAFSLPVGSCCLVPALGLFIACQMTSATTEIFSYFLLMTVPLLFIVDDSPIDEHTCVEA